MKKETQSVMFACALGSFIGTLVALEIATRFTYGSWFLGIGGLFGGLVAYCAVDFRNFCAGVARSYRKTINGLPDYAVWKAYLISLVGSCTVSISALIGLVLVTSLASLVEGESVTKTTPTNSTTIQWVMLTIAIAALAAAPVWAATHGPGGDKGRSNSLRDMTNFGWFLMWNFNPLAIVYWVLRGAWWAICQIPSIVISVPAFIRFCWTQGRSFAVGAFFYVHSERRKLCFVDATFGAVAGFFLGSAIAGAVVGAILGIINYEIVSIRWLKLVPAKMK